MAAVQLLPPNHEPVRLKCLIYCILHDREHAGHPPPNGVDGGPVSFLRRDGLAAAYSLTPVDSGTPSLSRIQAFARVVEALHQTGAVLPMRYGSFLQNEAEMAEWLRARHCDFENALDSLRDCVEMTLRLVLAASAAPREPSVGRIEAVPLAGSDYLRQQADHYARLDGQLRHAQELAETACEALRGLFVKSRTEPSHLGRAATLSLHFLVRRGELAPFREACSRLRERSRTPVFLTGPWPPYNFALSASSAAVWPSGGPGREDAETPHL